MKGQTYDTTSDGHTSSDATPHSTAAESAWRTTAGRKATLTPSLASVHVRPRTSLAALTTINAAEVDTLFREALGEALYRAERGSKPQKRRPFRAPVGHGGDEQPLESPAVSDTSNGSVSLSPQARCILDLIEQGHSNKEI